MVWRLIHEDGVGAAAGLACDEILARRAGERSSPPTLRLYTYRAHAALVGRFQNVENELHVPYCEANTVEINRRPTGGGAIIMGPDQLGVALALAGRNSDPARRRGARELMSRFSAGLVGALEGLGIRAGFRGKNDLAVQGRKIAGLGIHRDAGGGLLFHASLLVDLDLALMVRVLRTPFTDGDLEALAARTATVRQLLGSHVPMQEVRARVARGFAHAFEATVEAGELDGDERAALRALERDKYRSPEWVFQRNDVPDTTGQATCPAPGGDVEVRLSCAGSMIKSAHISGDFIENEAAIAELEARLRWHSSARDAVAATVQTWRTERGDGTVSTAALTEAIVAAAGGGAYGCFVTPREAGNRA